MSRTITPTHVLLNQVTLGVASSTVTFSNVPQGYGDLVLVINGTGTVADNQRARFNGDTGSNYVTVFARGTGSSTSSGSGTDAQFTFGEIDNSVVCTNTMQVFDYAQTDKHKAILQRSNDTTNSVFMYAGRWASTAAVTSISVYPASGSYNIGNVFSLYGVHA